MNTFKKLNSGAWGVATQASENYATGATVPVTTRTGAVKQVTLGEFVGNETAFNGRVVRLFTVAERAPRAVEQVGDLSGIMQLFARAQSHLRRPAIVLSVGGVAIRLSVAGSRARFPGSINVTAQDQRDADNRRAWFGRINRAGGFEPGRDAPEAIGAGLRRFAADPAGVAAEHGRLTGSCCFCNRALEDERSTSVGYGPICAGHYGLPWGARANRADETDGSEDYQRVARREEYAAEAARDNADDLRNLAQRAAQTAAATTSRIVEEYAAAVAEGRLPVDPDCTVSQMAARLRAVAE